MNKIIYILSAFIFFCSCDKDNIGEPSPENDNSIAFSVLQEEGTTTTRALVDDFAQGDKVSVLGYFLDDGSWDSTPSAASTDENPDFMYDQAVVKGSSDVWSYSPLKYWSNDLADRYKFFAYYPHQGDGIELATSNADAGYPSYNFTGAPSMTYDEQVDFMYAQTPEVMKPTSGGVDLEFNHALSKIRISGKVIEDPTAKYKNIVRVNSITISTPNSATLKHDDSAKGASWSEHAAPTNQTITLNRTEGTEQKPGIVLDQTPGMLIGGEDASDALLVIPHIPDGGEVTVTINYSLGYEIRPDDEYRFYHQTIDKQVVLDDEWEIGTSYHYALEFTVDDYEPDIKVKAELTDWGSTFDVLTSVIYTFLYVEKPEISLVYTDGAPISLEIYFSTNAEKESISAKLIRDNTDLDSQLNNTVTVNTEQSRVECVFYPSTDYSEESIEIKAGIISVEVKVLFIPQEEYDLTDLYHLSLYLNQEIGTVPHSNCYIINSIPTHARRYIIPITRQIEHMYPSSTVLDDNSWDVVIYAYDNAGPVNQLTIQPEEDRNGFDCFSVTIPQSYNNYGNVIVSVVDPSQVGSDGESLILWTWHLWVTDYDPYRVFNDHYTTPTTSGQTVVYHNETYGGSVYRHTTLDYSYILDRNIGATSTDFLGHGGLGGRGWLAYQYGRLAPILGHTAKFADGSIFVTNFHNVDADGAVTQRTSIQNPNTVYYSATGADWCSDISRGGLWNDKSYGTTKYAKSIYDPSPLGYMVPPLDEVSVSGWTTTDYGQTYTMSSGNTFNSTINIDPTTGRTNLVVVSSFLLWTNSSYTTGAGALKFGAYTATATTEDVSHDMTAPTTYGASIRSIFQFKQ